jgi:hypothetical protein
MIRNCGILLDPSSTRVEEAYSLYRDDGKPDSDHGTIAHIARQAAPALGNRPARPTSRTIGAAHATFLPCTETMPKRSPATFHQLTADHFHQAARNWRLHGAPSGFRDSQDWDVLVEGQRFPPKAITAMAHQLAGLGELKSRDFSGRQSHGFLHGILQSLGFELLGKAEDTPVALGAPVQVHSKGNAHATAGRRLPLAERPVPDGLTRERVIAAAARWQDQTDDYRRRHASTTYDVWIEGKPYPVKAICRLACESLGITDMANWRKGPHGSPWDLHLRSLGFDIRRKEEAQPQDLPPSLQSVADDIAEINDRALGATTRQRLIDARLGQGQFRKDLDLRWNNACAITGISTRAVLRASHIQPWADSDDDERLDPDNGLLLSANLDCLFDRGLIGFDDDGTLLVSDNLSAAAANALGLDDDLQLSQPPTDGQRRYLANHRDTYGFDEDTFDF